MTAAVGVEGFLDPMRPSQENSWAVLLGHFTAMSPSMGQSAEHATFPCPVLPHRGFLCSTFSKEQSPFQPTAILRSRIKARGIHPVQAVHYWWAPRAIRLSSDVADGEARQKRSDFPRAPPTTCGLQNGTRGGIRLESGRRFPPGREDRSGHRWRRLYSDDS
jgi:hypothetical protein